MKPVEIRLVELHVHAVRPLAKNGGPSDRKFAVILDRERSSFAGKCVSTMKLEGQ